jgi:Protein of unknown function (DUF3500)
MKLQAFSILLILNISTLFGQMSFDQKTSVHAATSILATLSAAQKTVGNLSFDDTSRLKWSNLPMERVLRKGLQFKDLADSQRMAIHQLLRTVLSQQGYQKFMFIIQYDEAIHERLVKAKSPIAQRHGNQNYWFTIFGTPSMDKIWSWKFEGHHLSLNITYSPKGVTCTPMFVGISPALTTSGPYAGYHVMSEENESGNQLFNSLTDVLKKKATTSPMSKDADVMTQTGKDPVLTGKKGVSYKEMTVKQQFLVEYIIRAWVENLTPTLADEKMKQVLAQKNNLLFTWQGTNNVNELHYYSLKTDTFIIEYTNRDQEIYHYHTIWRDLTEDFKSK